MLSYYLQCRVIVDTIQKSHIYHTKQYQTFYRKIKCDLLRIGTKWLPLRFSIFDGFDSFFFFVKWRSLCKVLCSINGNHEKKNFDFFDKKH